MSAVMSLLVLGLLIVGGALFFKTNKKARSDNYPTRIKNSLKVLDQLYRDVNGTEISLNERQRLNTINPSFTYGEATFPSIAMSLAIVDPKPGEVFYDLGAGAGKAVFCAALLNDWKKCCGIEYLPGLYDCTSTLLQKLKQMPDARKYFQEALNNIEFKQNDILEADFSDADVIYMNATAFTPDLWESIIPKLENLKIGARIILLTKRLNKDKFALLQETMLPMSWGMNSVHIYERI